MDDFSCPHCRSGTLIGGTCAACGWSISIARPDLPRRRSPATSIPSDPSRACWIQLPLAASVINFIGPIVSLGGSELFGILTAGAVAAQFGLLAIIGAVGPGSHAARLISTFVVAAGLLFALVVGITLGGGGPSGREFGGVFLVLPAVLLAAQAPLWLFRALSGQWMRAAAGASTTPSRKTQFGVAQMMWATALIAVAVALARGAIVLWARQSDPVPVPEWGRLAAVCGIVAIASGLVAVPATAAVMMPRNPGGAVVLTVVYAVMLTMALLGLITTVAGPAPVEFVVVLGLTSLTTFGGVLAGLGILRKCGYTMVSGGP